MKQLLLLIALFFSVVVCGQEPTTTDFLAEIKASDISDLWTLTKFETEFDEEIFLVNRAEPLGYIGENYQRFYIHFISVIQNPRNTLEYFVYGKTRVKKTICSFQGLIRIDEAKTYYDSEIPLVKQGFVLGSYEFFEEKDHDGSGILKGSFRTDFCIGKKGTIEYNSLLFISDGYKNNQFEGTWSSYQTGITKKCNWGDYRIPDSKELDNGAGEFGVSDRYVSNGWIGYMAMNAEVRDKMIKETEKNRGNPKWWCDEKE